MARMQIANDSNVAGPKRARTARARVGRASRIDVAALARRVSPEHRRLALALLFSLLFHAGLLSLTFGGDQKGLPGLFLPWRERRIEVPDLHIVLVPAPVAPASPAPKPDAEPSLQATIEAPAAAQPPEQVAPPPAKRAPGKAAVKSPVAKPAAAQSCGAPQHRRAAAADAPIVAPKPGRVPPVPAPAPLVALRQCRPAVQRRTCTPRSCRRRAVMLQRRPHRAPTSRPRPLATLPLRCRRRCSAWRRHAKKRLVSRPPGWRSERQESLRREAALEERSSRSGAPGRGACRRRAARG